MEVLSPEILLLKESEKVRLISVKEFASDETSNGSIFGWTGWLYPEREECYNHEDGKKLHRPVNKVSSQNYQQFVKGRRSMKCLNVKFEHFDKPSRYIEQYRHAKLLKLEQRVEKLVHHSKKHGKFETNSCINEQHQVHLCKHEHGRFSSCLQSGRHSNPSLPEPGGFSGRKWIYPKVYDERVLNKNIRINCCPRVVYKEAYKQVPDQNTAMMLCGTGKPLLTSPNQHVGTRLSLKCKSAPPSRQYQLNPSDSRVWTNVSENVPKSRHQTKLLTCSDLSSLMTKHSFCCKPNYSNIYIKSNDNKVEYKNIFENVLDIYDQSSVDSTV